MLTLPDSIIAILAPFASLFSTPVFRHVQVLIAGAILTPGRHTVANALRLMGLAHTHRFGNYHRVLNRDKWSSRRAAKVLLSLLIAAFVPDSSDVLVGIDETLERRRGAKIAAKGIYRDAVRSSKSQVVKSSGLRWICMMLLVPMPWAVRILRRRSNSDQPPTATWALPFLSVLAPSERYDREHLRCHKTIATWGLQMVVQLRRWLPRRKIVLVGDSTYASLSLLNRCVRFENPVTMVTRLRLDAALFEPAPARVPGQRGRPRLKGERLPSPQEVLDDPNTEWSRVMVPDWYASSSKSINSQRGSDFAAKSVHHEVSPKPGFGVVAESAGAREVEIVTRTGNWYHPGERPVPIRYVLIREPEPGATDKTDKTDKTSAPREDKLVPQALLCTDLSAEPLQIVSWFVKRWQLETTFQEVRTHLGVETQRQWSDLAILRTTPALLGLFSFVTLVADRLARSGKLSVRTAAWYPKDTATFADVIACVRREIWQRRLFCMSGLHRDMGKISHDLFATMEEALCYAM